METLISTSIIAAFLAGVAALFAPCCIAVLLPSYLGSVFKERYKVTLMTIVFFFGILTVFLPLGLGAAALAQFFTRYHTVIFTAGGLFLVALGIGLVLGKNFSVPSPVRPALKDNSVASVYLLGVFSAIATTCCAPVLAGVLALSVASGSVFWGGIYTVSYVFGIVSPLIVIAIFLDKVDLTRRLAPLHASRTVILLGAKWRVVFSEFIAGVIFLVMGAYIIYLALTDNLFTQSEYQLGVNLFIAPLVEKTGEIVRLIPGFEFIFAGLAIIALGAIIRYAYQQFRRK